MTQSKRVRVIVGYNSNANLLVSSDGAEVERPLGRDYSQIEIGLPKPYNSLSQREKDALAEAVRIAEAVSTGRGVSLSSQVSGLSVEELRTYFRNQEKVDAEDYVNRTVDIPNLNKRVKVIGRQEF